MASTLVNVPCNVGLIKPSINQSFISVRVEIKANSRRNLIVRARDTKNESIEKTGLSIEECEAAVVAGKPSEAPPVPPNAAAPAGTPSVLFQLSRCPRRNRKSPAMRASFQETSSSPANFVYPLFIHEGEEDTPIGAMPGCYRLGWRHGLVEEMNPANYREALIEARADESEGADILLVKPGLPYLDIVRLLHDTSPLPIAAYQVSGEYSMIKAGGVLKMIDEEKVMLESLMCLRRAGADIILTYIALQAARCLCGEKR